MSGFDIEWLDLREPVDGRARNPQLLHAAAMFMASSHRPSIVDIGSGTGATFRAIAPQAPAVHWRLIDHDEQLLQDAARRNGESSNIAYQVADLNDVTALSLEEAGLVTASALFDLCSETFIEALAERLVAFNTGLYAALNYNGEIVFGIPHPDDGVVLELFNLHQQSDKGFGPALGPQSTDALDRIFSSKGYRVAVGSSDWLIDELAPRLHRAFVDGIAAAIIETGALTPARIQQWRDFRLDTAGSGTCRVGHADVLALPSNTEL